MERAAIRTTLLLVVTGAPAAAQSFEFVDVTEEVGLRVPLGIPTPGVAVGDYDGDGWLDVVVFGAETPSPQVYRNHGGDIAAGRGVRWFGNVSPYCMPPNATPASAGILADLDQDGDQDMVVSYRYPHPGLPSGNHLDVGIRYYENSGRYFRNGVVIPDLGRDATRHGGLALGDVDGDSDLDIVFQHNGAGGGLGGPGFFIRNNGLPNLVDDTAAFGADLGQSRRNFSAVLVDFDRDGDLDLHTAVDFFPDYHCHNNGDGTFEFVSPQVGTMNGGADMGLAIGDIENDGDLDIYSTNIGIGVLYVNDGDGNFQNEAVPRGCGSWGSAHGVAVGWGTMFADFDHDMDQDLVFVAYAAPGLFFENDGTGHFTTYEQEDVGLILLGHGLITFDYDKDGDLDVLTMRQGMQFPHLFENRSPVLEGRHWLVVELEGVQSNRDGVGAYVEVTAGGVTQTRAILAGQSFKSGPPMNAHFGLGTNAVADEVRVLWPSGLVQTLENVATDRYLEIVEGVTR